VFGFHGRYWRYDLGSGSGESIAIPEAVLRRYLGGVGLGAWLLEREGRAGQDPLAPEAPLVFSFSPLVGTPLTTSAKLAVVAKSPLTGMVSDGLSSSHFAIAGKRTGFDAIVLVGRCAEPSELVNGELRPTALWGASAEETRVALEPYGRVAAIGVAGENRVRFATISNDGRHAGRGGLGAVMGAKLLKALVVRGNRPTLLANPKRVMSLARDLSQRSLGPATAKYRELGTAANVMAFNRIAALPTRNFQTSCWNAADALSPEELTLDRSRTRSACASCTIGCEHRYPLRTHGDEDGEVASARIEYESLFALGPLCGVADPDAVIELSQRCDALGLDTVSAGGTLAFAMECGERGYLEGAPRFGEVGAMLATLDDIAQRRGLGARLAEGSRHLAVEIGRDALDFAPQVKGLELPGYEPRALQTMALGFAVGTRGADHNRSGAYEVDFSPDVERTHGSDHGARRAVETENRAALTDSLILCKFLRGVFDDFYGESAELLEAVTGWDFDAEELQAVARRIVGLRKALNVREGWSPILDTLPERFFREPLQEGASAGARLPRERLAGMILAYHRERGWSDDGYLLGPELHDLARDTALGEPGVPG